jgi:pimeloyl-ACP methyl ester carboxylesterase
MNSRKGVQVAMGMHFSVVCAEDMPRIDLSRDTPGVDFGTGYATMYRRVCENWPRGAVPAAFYDIPPTTTPTLLFSGALDPATPPRHGERVASALGPAAKLVIVPNSGHGALGIGCARDVVYRFIDASQDDQAGAIDASCLKDIPRPGVFQPIHLPTQAAN